jgi:hypothetical protein
MSNLMRNLFKAFKNRKLSILVVISIFVTAGCLVYLRPDNLIFASGSGTITISSPKKYQVIQRDANNIANIEIKGTYTGNATAIEANWKRNGNWVGWQVIDENPVGGKYSGVLVGQEGGQGALQVRFANDNYVQESVSYIGIGDVIVIAGGSNASGRGKSNQKVDYSAVKKAAGYEFKAVMFGNDYEWKLLEDPIDSCKNQVDMVSCDKTAGGSQWPLIATEIMKSQKVPVAFIPTAKGGSTMPKWQKNCDFYRQMENRIQKSGNKIKMVVFQGASGAIQGYDSNTFSTLTNNFANSVYADFGAKVAVAQQSDATSKKSGAYHRITKIRTALQKLWDEDNNVTLGPITYDINLKNDNGDGLHFKTTNELEILARRWWAAIDETYYNPNADGRGAKLTKAVLTSNRRYVYLYFDDKSLPLNPRRTNIANVGFLVRDSKGSIDVKYAYILGTKGNRVKLKLARKSTSKNLQITYGYGRTAMPTSKVMKDTNRLPVEVFYRYPVSIN